MRENTENQTVMKLTWKLDLAPFTASFPFSLLDKFWDSDESPVSESAIVVGVVVVVVVVVGGVVPDS